MTHLKDKALWVCTILMCLAYTLGLELRYINLKINTKVICDEFFFFLVRRFVMIIVGAMAQSDQLGLGQSEDTC